MRGIISSFFFLFFIASIYSGDKKVNKISPLSDSYNQTFIKPKDIPESRINKFHLFNQNNSKEKKWRVKFNSLTALPEIIAGDKTRRYYGKSENIFASFIEENKELLGVDLTNLKKVREYSFSNMTHLEYEQYYKNLPVEFSYVKLHLNKNGEISIYSAKYYPDIDLDINPKISLSDALSAIKKDNSGFNLKSSQLVIYPDNLGKYHLSWKINGRSSYGKSGLWIYYIDAYTSDILFSYDNLKYSCSPSAVTTGTIKGEVYEISPIPNPIPNESQSYWTPKISTPIANEYVWIGNYLNKTTTTINGEYCSDLNGRIYTLFQGPYFSVSNFMGKSSYYTNGGEKWYEYDHLPAIESNNPYINSSTYTYNLSIPNPPEGFAFVSPLFSNFNVGSLDTCGSAKDGDNVEILSNGYRVASYIGYNPSFIGGYSANPNYNLVFKTDDINISTSYFKVSISSYMVLNSTYPANNSTGSIIWSTSNYLADSNGAEVNSFYHLNKIKNFFDTLNKDYDSPNKLINIDKQVPVMVHAFGNTTEDGCEPDTMRNAYYDEEYDQILLGKGPLKNGIYRDFALDGTIIRHEYTHLVVNRIYPIINFGEFGAISEAMADYFSLTSFWKDKVDIAKLGNFIDAGEAASRDLSTCVSGTPCKMPNDWVGEVHDDSMILSRALYELRKGSSDLGACSNCGNFTGLYRADVFVFSALFYFPDNFTNFLEAVMDSCKQIDKDCDDSMLGKIKTAFANHGIYPASEIISRYAIKDKNEPNNSPEWATDISTINSIIGYIDYGGDIDYYSVALNQGILNVNLQLPSSPIISDMYDAYNIFLFDENRKILKESYSDIYTCSPPNSPSECLTKNSYNTLTYNIGEKGRYYILITAALSEYGSNGPYFNNTNPYILSYEGNLKGSISASISQSSFDADQIDFNIQYPKFSYSLTPSTDIWNNKDSSELLFEYARLLDHNLNPIPNTETNNPSSYITLSTYTYGNGVISGAVKLKSGFSDRYPAIGTVYLEVFATNHMQYISKSSNTFSLGISNPINLSTNKNDFLIYNNIITPTNTKCFLKYDSLSSGNLSIKIYTPTGALVKTVYDGYINSGKGTFEWDGKDDKGSKLASGIYFVKVKGPNISKTDKIAIVR